MQRILRFVIDEEELVLGQAPYYFDTIEGLSSSLNEINSQSSISADGYIFKNTKLIARSIAISGRIRGNTRAEALEYRRKMISLLNSKRGLGVLEVIYSDGTKYYIEAFCDNGVQITEQNESVVKGNVFSYSLVFTCPFPYWKQEDIYYTHLSQVIPRFEFAFEIEADNPDSFIFGDVHFNQPTEIDNKGDCPTGFTCEISGQLTDYFSLTKLNTKEYIKIEMDFTNVTKLEINSLQGNKKIFVHYKDGTVENGFKYMDFDSTFFELNSGINSVMFSTNAADVDINVQIKHQNLYVGL